jgi:hypothetical protein
MVFVLKWKQFHSKRLRKMASTNSEWTNKLRCGRDRKKYRGNDEMR